MGRIVYAKIFGQILDSSIARDSGMRRMFQDLCILANSDGEVDMTYFAIAQRLVVPEAEVVAEIAKLMLPDPDSRSTDEEGRRLVPLQAGRKWGWRIVNYMKYRKTHDEETRKEQNRDRAQRCRDKKKMSVTQRDGALRSVTPVIRNEKSRQEEEEEEEEELTAYRPSDSSANSADFSESEKNQLRSSARRHHASHSNIDTPAEKPTALRPVPPRPHPVAPSQPVVVTETVSGPAAALPREDDENRWTQPTDAHGTVEPPPVATVNAQAVITVKASQRSADAIKLYKAYPRKVGSGAAIKAIEKALLKNTFETLLEAVEAYARSPAGNNGQFTPHAATWFNQERWNDDRDNWKCAGGNEQRETAVITDAHKQQVRALMAQRAAEESAFDPPI